jgi:hypothetical protein
VTFNDAKVERFFDSVHRMLWRVVMLISMLMFSTYLLTSFYRYLFGA